jgi:hypothetical protein
MPAQSKSQANYMRMALAIKRGHKLTGIDPATKQRLRKTAASMSEASLRDFVHVAKRPKKTS